MKRTLFIFIIILVGLFGSLTFLGRKGEYAAEKKLWNINQDFQEITRDPKTTPIAVFSEIAVRYKNFIHKFPKSNLTSQANIILGKVYLFKKNYTQARVEFEKIIKQYSNNPVIVTQSLKEILNSYAMQKDFENIFKTYQRILKDYPLTSLGLNVPVLTAKLHLFQGNIVEQDKAFEKAIIHYKNLIKEYPNSMIELHSQELIATVYLKQNKWKKAIHSFGEILIRFSDPRFLTPKRVVVLTRAINNISISKLKNTQLPINVYKKFILAHPNHQFNQAFQEIIEKLKVFNIEQQPILKN